MSLVNQMLQDLDKRRADPDAGEMPEGVRVTHTTPVRQPWRRWLPGLLVLLVILIALGFYGGRSSSPASLPQVEPLAAAAPVDTPAPALPAIPSVAQTATPEESADALPSAVGQDQRVESKAVPEKAKPKETPPIASRTAAPTAEKVRPGNENRGNSAVDRVKTGISTAPEESEAQLAERLYLSARESHLQGRLSVSQEKLSQALATYPAHRGARNLRVQQLLDAGQATQATELLAEGLRLLPAEIPWLKVLARLRLEGGQLAEASTLLERLPELARDADVRVLAGAIAYRQQDYPAAANHYRAALAQRPNVGRDWVALALVLEAQGHQPEAREAFRRALLTGNLDPRLQALAESRLQL